MAQGRLEQLDEFLNSFITAHFESANEKFTVILNALSLEQKVDVFEYITQTPIMDHPLFKQRFGPESYY